MDETPISIADYDPTWADRFEAERDRLGPWIGDYVSRLEHVGNTSVPGLAAKPIVDITAVVSDISGLWGDLDKLSAALGYELSHVPGDWLFVQRTDADGQAYNLHLIERSSEQWRHDLRFREYLRARPAVRDEYETVKREAAAANRDDIDAYNAAKAQYCESIVERALDADDISVPARNGDEDET